MKAMQNRVYNLQEVQQPPVVQDAKAAAEREEEKRLIEQAKATCQYLHQPGRCAAHYSGASHSQHNVPNGTHSHSP